MGLVRLVHPKHWEAGREGFTDLAFKPPLSVFDVECAEHASSGLICQHVRKYYPTQGGDPPVLMFIEEGDLPPGCALDANRSDSGDDCHREVIAKGKSLIKALKRSLMDRHWSTLKVCAPDGIRDLTAEDIATWSAQVE